MKSLSKPILVQSSRLSRPVLIRLGCQNQSDCVSLHPEKQTPRGIWDAPRCRRRCHRTSPPFIPRTLLSAISDWLLARGFVRVVAQRPRLAGSGEPDVRHRGSTVTTAVSSRLMPTANPIGSGRASGPIRWISKISTLISSASLGPELESNVLDSCGVVHYVPGIPHGPDERRHVNKPFIQMMWVIGPRMQSYYDAAPFDKIHSRREAGPSHDYSWGGRLRAADQNGRLGLALSRKAVADSGVFVSRKAKTPLANPHLCGSNARCQYKNALSR